MPPVFSLLGTGRRARANARRAIADRINALALTEQGRKSVTVTRTGTFFDSRYVEFEITRRCWRNGPQLRPALTAKTSSLMLAHRPSSGAAGKITRLWVSSDRLLAEVDGRPFGPASHHRARLSVSVGQFLRRALDQQRNPSIAWRRAVGRGADHPAGNQAARSPQLPTYRPPSRVIRATTARPAPSWTSTCKPYSNDSAEQQNPLAKTVIDQLGEAFTAGQRRSAKTEAALTALVVNWVETGKTG